MANAFECTLCGRCCMGMGNYVTIERKVNDAQYICRHGLAREIFHATVERPYRLEFMENAAGRDPKWCPFLMKTGDGETYACCIHATRPRFCREYKCYTVRILNAAGTEVGRVRGRRTLASEDPALLGLWEGTVAPLSAADDAGWRRELKRILGEAEYRVVFYD
jgi:Fe-S-cluster containining protein